MAATEFEIIRDEQERSNLLRSIAAIESAIAAAKPGTRRILESTVDSARKRLTTLDKKIEEAQVEHAAEVQARAASAAALAAKETKLNAAERETYRGFLQESYFTKKDFGKLDEFYTHSYDRLSKDGKEEMSKRIHEGIRRGEFKESDLPESMLKRDAKLSREHSTEKTAETNSRNSNTDGQNHARNAVNNSALTKLKQPTMNGLLDLSAVDLKGVNLVEATSEPMAASIPDASSRSACGRT